MLLRVEELAVEGIVGAEAEVGGAAVVGLVVAAGEQWKDGGLRPCLEDMIGAGAVLSRLPGGKSPEARWAVRTFEGFAGDLRGTLNGCLSGRELIERGFPEDVEVAASLNVSETVPILREKCFQAM